MPASFTEQIPSFEEKLQRVNIQAVTASPYGKRYLGHLLEHRRYFVKIYARVLDIAARHGRKDLSRSTLLDYGAGNGLLGLFAKHCGIGKVYINDIDPVFTEASQSLAAILDIRIDGFITGDTDKVCSVLANDPPDLICGTDVIEHIYDLPAFLRQIRSLNPSILTVFTTAANAANPIKKKKIIQLQLQDENKGSNPMDSALAGEKPHPSFLSMRRLIIRSAAPELNTENVDKLALITRGLKEKDIREAVSRLLHEGKTPIPPVHPTNTCNPETGSWTERLLTKEEYNSLYVRAGFDLTMYNGFYDTCKMSIPKNIINQILNIGVRMVGRKIAPYIILVGNSTVFNEI